ncbi:MAG: HAMP domain-containing histidine kinase [Actinomycetia bacterium]|nr:HAMP domain-containing histidine kinase [Actinomycetes bacterium]
MPDLQRDDPQASTDETQQVVYAISHDLRASARHIKSFVQLLEGHLGEQLDDEARDYINRIGTAADSLQAKLDALTRLSRVATGGVEPVPCSVREALNDALTVLGPSIRGARVIVGVDPMGMVIADPGQLVTVFVEVIGNALKFCSEPTQIRVTSEADGDRCIVRVVDSGPGFRTGDCNAAFELFRRFHKATIPGTGTGLAIVRRIGDRHRAGVTIDSSPDGGTTVQFTLPAVTEHTAGDRLARLAGP